MKIRVTESGKTIESKSIYTFPCVFGVSEENPIGKDAELIGIQASELVSKFLNKESETQVYLFKNILYIDSKKSEYIFTTQIIAKNALWK